MNAAPASDDKSGIGIVLGGIGPSMTLMSGAMLGFAEAFDAHRLETGRRFDFEVISTSGAGALVGMLYLAPRAGSREKALADLPNLFVSDLLHRVLPFNFKAFGKHGPFSRPLWELGRRLPRFSLAGSDSSPVKRLLNDWVDLSVSALTPTTYEFLSKGLMTQLPVVDHLVDFEALNALETPRFYLNAFNNSKRTLEIFPQTEPLSAKHYHAAASMMFLFPPQRIRSMVLSTGATHDPSGLRGLLRRAELPKLDKIIALDTVAPAYRREPQNIYDAFQLMLMNPVVTLHQHTLALYAQTEYEVNENGVGRAKGKHLPKLYRVPFDIDPRYYPNMLKWSHSNGATLQGIGHDAAAGFAAALLAGDDEALEPYRFYNYVKESEPLRDLLSGFARSLRTASSHA